MVAPTRWRKTIYLVLAIALVLSSSLLTVSLNTTRDRWTRGRVGESFPPSIVLGTQMLGSFRGMLMMGLWLRANALQDQGRYYELVQLYGWITELEPGIEDVWAYSAWNMAYNVSVAFSLEDPSGYEERWRWVQNGLAELRDRALKLYHPRSYLLHHQLAWMYFHKVAGRSDEAHWYYKRRFAEALHPILGGPTPDFARLARAPERAEELLKDKAVAALVEAMRAVDFDPFDAGLGWLNDRTKLPEAVRPIVEEKEGSPELDALDAFLRARALRQNWRIDPGYAKELVDEYGPLDFRQPEAHALYWAAQSLDPRYTDLKKDDNRMHGQRIVYFALVQIYESGRLYYEPKRHIFWREVDLRFADTIRDHFTEIFRLYPETEKTGVESAFRNWMRNAIAIMYEHNEKDKAREYLDILRKKYDRPEYKVPVEDFVLSEVMRDLEQGQYEQVQASIRGYVFQHYYWLALGEVEVAAAHKLIAQQLYERFVEKAPKRYQEQLGTWDELLNWGLLQAVNPKGLLQDRALRDRLRNMFNLPSEEDEAAARAAEAAAGRATEEGAGRAGEGQPQTP